MSRLIKLRSSTYKKAERCALSALLDAIDSGMEYARECLCRHKAETGVTRPLGKRFADAISADIDEMQRAKGDLLLIIRAADEELEGEE
jgi:hypothetical protein